MSESVEKKGVAHSMVDLPYQINFEGYKKPSHYCGESETTKSLKTQILLQSMNRNFKTIGQS